MYLNVSMSSISRNIASLFLISLLLTSCSWNSQPPRRVVIEALQTQIVATQTSISESLGLDPMINAPTISRVRVEHHDDQQVEGESLSLIHI